jgi:hypothetical protein
VLDVIDNPDPWLTSGGFTADEQAFLRQVVAHLRFLARWRSDRLRELPEIIVSRLTHRDGFAILIVPPDGEQPDRFEYWVDEHYIPAAKRADRPAALRADVEENARLLRAAYAATAAEPPPPSLVPSIPASPTARATALHDELFEQWRKVVANRVIAP